MPKKEKKRGGQQKVQKGKKERVKTGQNIFARVNFERGKIVLSCGGEGICEAFSGTTWVRVIASQNCRETAFCREVFRFR